MTPRVLIFCSCVILFFLTLAPLRSNLYQSLLLYCRQVSEFTGSGSKLPKGTAKVHKPSGMKVTGLDPVAASQSKDQDGSAMSRSDKENLIGGDTIGGISFNDVLAANILSTSNCTQYTKNTATSQRGSTGAPAKSGLDNQNSRTINQGLTTTHRYRLSAVALDRPRSSENTTSRILTARRIGTAVPKQTGSSSSRNLRQRPSTTTHTTVTDTRQRPSGPRRVAIVSSPWQHGNTSEHQLTLAQPLFDSFGDGSLAYRGINTFRYRHNNADEKGAAGSEVSFQQAHPRCTLRLESAGYARGLGSANTYARIQVKTKHDYLRGAILVGHGLVSQSNDSIQSRKCSSEHVVLEGFLDLNKQTQPLQEDSTHSEEQCAVSPLGQRTDSRVQPQIQRDGSATTSSDPTRELESDDDDLSNLRVSLSQDTISSIDEEPFTTWKQSPTHVPVNRKSAIVVPCHTSGCDLCGEYYSSDDGEAATCTHTVTSRASDINKRTVGCHTGGINSRSSPALQGHQNNPTTKIDNSATTRNNHVPRLQLSTSMRRSRARSGRLYELDHDDTTIATREGASGMKLAREGASRLNAGTRETSNIRVRHTRGHNIPVCHTRMSHSCGMSHVSASFKPVESPRFSYTKYRTTLL